MGSAGAGSAGVPWTPPAHIVSLTNNEAGTVVPGAAVYLSAASGFLKARANATATSVVVGLVSQPSGILTTASGAVTEEGMLTLTTAEWDAVTGGSGGLTYGAVYWLDASTAGKITLTNPSATAISVIVGVGVSTTKMMVGRQQRPSGAYIGRQTITTNVTYTPTVGARVVFLRMVGCGGGGGGTSGTGGGIAIGAGGASGAYLEKRIDPAALITGGSATMGSAGAAGASGGGNGGTGGDAVITIQAVTYTCKGGAGGAYSANAPSEQQCVGGTPTAGSTTGDVNNAGEPGCSGWGNGVNNAMAGHGGSSIFGGGGIGQPGIGAGVVGYGPGAGGSGAVSTTVSYAGGAGKIGVIIIDEYS